ncbi:MAG: GFA family protein [Phreatobacter sp.]|nr:GFA family protein [Phreatobacter sp.]
MCQKASGGYFAPFSVAQGLVWTRGEPKRFASSNMARRGFCADCGTPLTYEYDDVIDVSLGSLDDPAAFPPIVQIGLESRLAFVADLPALPVRDLATSAESAAFLAQVISRQHPDHDTEVWPPADRTP